MTVALGVAVPDQQENRYMAWINTEPHRPCHLIMSLDKDMRE